MRANEFIRGQKAIHLSGLPRFFKKGDPLVNHIPERGTHTFALHPDKWQSTFYSLTNKDLEKLKYYKPKEIDMEPGTLVGDMYYANKFYRAKDDNEKQKFLKLYKDSLKPVGSVDIKSYRMPELLIPKNEIVQEGVNDPAIFKVVFVVGGPGSGKSYVSRELGLNAMGFVTVNSDVAFEYMMKKHDLDPKMPPEQKTKRDTVRSRAKEVTGLKSDLAIEGRLGIHIDGTGDDFDKINNLKKNFEQLGYDSFLVVVNTKLEVAKQRNQMRARTVPDDIVTNSWYNVQDNIGRFFNVFKYMAIIDNSGDGKATEQQINNVHVKLKKFVEMPPNKPAAKEWIASQKNTNEASYAGNLGAMEMIKFKQVATPELWALMKKLIADGKEEEAWLLLQKVTKTKLQ
jgi:dephospho-CoA kinase